jgi:hypothetical protein
LAEVSRSWEKAWCEPNYPELNDSDASGLCLLDKIERRSSGDFCALNLLLKQQDPKFSTLKLR